MSREIVDMSGLAEWLAVAAWVSVSGQVAAIVVGRVAVLATPFPTPRAVERPMNGSAKPQFMIKRESRKPFQA